MGSLISLPGRGFSVNNLCKLKKEKPLAGGSYCGTMMYKKDITIPNDSQFFLYGIDEITCNEKKVEILRKRVFQQQVVIRKLRQEIAELKNKPRKDDEYLEFYAQNSTDKKFYSSREWRKVRFEALLKQKNCVLCGSDGPLHVDHISPRYLRPDLALDIKNLQILCQDCNIGKGTKKIVIRKKSKATVSDR